VRVPLPVFGEGVCPAFPEGRPRACRPAHVRRPERPREAAEELAFWSRAQSASKRVSGVAGEQLASLWAVTVPLCEPGTAASILPAPEYTSPPEDFGPHAQAAGRRRHGQFNLRRFGFSPAEKWAKERRAVQGQGSSRDLEILQGIVFSSLLTCPDTCYRSSPSLAPAIFGGMLWNVFINVRKEVG